MSMASSVISGGAGFIYSHVARHFVNLGWDVIIADHFDMQGKGKNIADLLPRVRLIIGDLTVGALAARCAEVRPDYVVHAAAYTHVDDSITDPERFMLNNVLGTTRLLQAFSQSGHIPTRILIVSTDEVYGSTPPGVAFTESQPFAPSNAYAASKVVVEAIAGAFHTTHTLPILIVRPCNTYAPGQFPAKVIPKFIGQLLRNELVTLYNDGQGSRDWLHAEDHARAVETILDRGQVGEAYNLGADEEHTDRDILIRIEAILSYLGYLTTPGSIAKVPGRPGHDRRYRMQTDKLRALGWVPQVAFSDGLRETVRWNAEHQEYWAHDLVGVAG